MSLTDSDRKANTKTKKGKKNSESQKKMEVSLNSTVLPGNVKIETLAQKKLANFQSTLPPLCQTPPNIGEDGSDDDNVEEKSHEDLPWHHQQLYRMYGQKADYFLHPKMEPEIKKTVDPNLKKYEGTVKLV